MVVKPVARQRRQRHPLPGAQRARRLLALARLSLGGQRHRAGRGRRRRGRAHAARAVRLCDRRRGCSPCAARTGKKSRDLVRPTNARSSVRPKCAPGCCSSRKRCAPRSNGDSPRKARCRAATSAPRRHGSTALRATDGQPADLCAVYATAMAEENAAGGRVVSAPSSGAAGPVAALLQFWRDGGSLQQEDRAIDFLLAGAAVGGLLRSAGVRQVGCQGEVGVAAAMAAAGYAAVLGGSNAQVLYAAERGLEPHLGLACDPAVAGSKTPCIERNAWPRRAPTTRGECGARAGAAHGPRRARALRRAVRPRHGGAAQIHVDRRGGGQRRRVLKLLRPVSVTTDVVMRAPSVRRAGSLDRQRCAAARWWRRAGALTFNEPARRCVRPRCLSACGALGFVKACVVSRVTAIGGLCKPALSIACGVLVFAGAAPIGSATFPA